MSDKRERLAEEYKQALDRVEAVDPDSDEGLDMTFIGHADVGAKFARLHLVKVVQKARDNGRTWDQIARVLGTSKQAARERFGP
jgi:hypothetical protein